MENLPDELKLELLSQISESNLAKVSRLNKSWNFLSSDEVIWKRLYLQRWGGGSNVVMLTRNQQNWKSTFQKRYSIDKNWNSGGRDVVDKDARIGSCQMNSEYLLTSGWRNSIFVQPMSDLAAEPRKIRFPQSKVSAIDLHPHVKSLAAIGCEWQIRLVDLQQDPTSANIFARIPTRQLECTGWIETIKFSPDGATLYSANGSQIRLLDLASGVDTLLPGGHAMNVLCLSAAQSIVASGSLDKLVRIWDMRRTAGSGSSADCVATLNLHGNRSSVRAVHLECAGSTPSKVIVPYTLSQSLAVWDMRNHSAPYSQLTFASGVNRMFVCAESGKTILGHMNGDVRIVNTSALLRGDSAEAILSRATRLVASRHSARVEGLCANLTTLVSASSEELIVTKFD